MSNLGPVYLAWSHVRHRGAALFGPLLMLVVCHVLLFTLVGMLPLIPPRPPDQGANGGEASKAEPGHGEPDHEKAVAGTVGMAVVLVVILLLFRHIAVTEADGQARGFAMLRTLGYPPTYVQAVLLTEMLLLVLLAAVPALLLLPGVDAFVRAWTDWPLTLGPGRVALGLLLQLMLGALAALLAMRKARALNPADLFG
jgi:hypothetical protein